MSETRKQNKQIRKALHDLLDDPEVFKAWLHKQNKDRDFNNGSTCGCPLWSFLNDSLSNLNIRPQRLEVDCDTVKWICCDGITKSRETLPKWASKFSNYDYDLAIQGVKVTGCKYALKMLVEVMTA